MDTPEWYTPSPFVEAAREVMGAIDLDPASHIEANVRVKASRFYDMIDNGLERQWKGRVFINPPGGKGPDGKPLVPQFWGHLMHEWAHDNTEQAIWIGYSLEQLQTLQRVSFKSPLDFPICIPHRRIAFIENEAKKAARREKLIAEGKDPDKASGPSHSNYVTYLGPKVDDFVRVFSELGQVKL